MRRSPRDRACRVPRLLTTRAFFGDAKQAHEGKARHVRSSELSKVRVDASSALVATGTTGTVEPDGASFTRDTGDIAPGKTATIIVTATVMSATAGLVNNAASTPTDTVVVTDPVSETPAPPTTVPISAGRTPNTGDSALREIAMALELVMVGVIVVGIALLYRRRRNKANYRVYAL